MVTSSPDERREWRHGQAGSLACLRCAGVESTDLFRHGLLPREPLEEVGVLQFYDLLELRQARLIERAEVLLSLRTRTTKRGEERQVCV